MKREIAVATFLLLFGSWQGRPVCAEVTDQIVKRTTGAAIDLARGNRQGALAQAVPAVQYHPASQTQLSEEQAESLYIMECRV